MNPYKKARIFIRTRDEALETMVEQEIAFRESQGYHLCKRKEYTLRVEVYAPDTWHSKTMYFKKSC